MHRLLPALVLAATVPTLSFADGHGAIVEAQQAWAGVLSGDNPAAVADFFTEDARLLPQDGAMVEGRDAIVEFWSGLIEGPATIELGMVDVDMLGTTAVETGTYALTIPGDDGDTVLTGKTLVIWKQGDDGSWRMAQDMWNDGI